MTADEAQTLVDHIDAAFARAEGRLTSMVNERNTRVIDATTAIVQALHDELRATTEAVDGLSANIAARRAYLDERMALAENRIMTLADLVEGGAEALGLAPVRALLDIEVARSTDEDARLWWAVRLIAVALLLLIAVVAWRLP